MPTLSPQLGAGSDCAQAAVSAMQGLRVTLANIKAGGVTKAETAVMQITARIDAPLARIQALMSTYQGMVANAQNRVTRAMDMILTWLLVSAIALTLLFLNVALALMLLRRLLAVYSPWTFPSLRIERMS